MKNVSVANDRVGIGTVNWRSQSGGVRRPNLAPGKTSSVRAEQYRPDDYTAAYGHRAPNHTSCAASPALVELHWLGTARIVIIP